MESIWADAHQADLVEAEAVHSGDRRRWPGTPLYNRRQAQYKVIRDLWALIRPGELISDRFISTLLARGDLGEECVQVVSSILAAHDNHEQFGEGNRIDTPRQFFMEALMHDTDPDYVSERAKLRAKIKARKEQEAEPDAA